MIDVGTRSLAGTGIKEGILEAAARSPITIIGALMARRVCDSDPGTVYIFHGSPA